MHIARRRNKIWFRPRRTNTILTSTELQEMKNIKIVGLMGMATFTDNQNQIKRNSCI
jgi:uncharacterized pyridoxal phosphate-containing UPF0001 family protein